MCQPKLFCYTFKDCTSTDRRLQRKFKECFISFHNTFGILRLDLEFNMVGDKPTSQKNQQSNHAQRYAGRQDTRWNRTRDSTHLKLQIPSIRRSLTSKGPPTPEASILGEKFPNKLSDKLDSTEGPSSRLYRKIQPWLQFFRNHVRRQAVQRPCQTSGNDVERPCWQTSMKMQKNTHVKVQGTMLGGKLGGWETSWTAWCPQSAGYCRLTSWFYECRYMGNKAQKALRATGQSTVVQHVLLLRLLSCLMFTSWTSCPYCPTCMKVLLPLHVTYYLGPFKFWIMFPEVPKAMCFWNESHQSILVVKALGYEVEPLQA